MGYSTNRKTLDQIRPLLTQLEQGLACAWQVAEGTENKWAYKIREALYIARLYPREYPTLAAVAGKFKVEVARMGLVKATPATNSVQPLVLTQGQARVVEHGLDGDPLRGLHSGRSVELTGPQTPASIMQAWFDTQPSNHPLFFPEAMLGPDQLVELHGLCAPHALIFFESEGRLTLQRRTADLADVAWDPSDLDEGIEVMGAVEVPFEEEDL